MIQSILAIKHLLPLGELEGASLSNCEAEGGEDGGEGCEGDVDDHAPLVFVVWCHIFEGLWLRVYGIALLLRKSKVTNAEERGAEDKELGN